MHPIEITISMGIDAAEAAVRDALTEQGFGVLTEIDVAATLRAKLGVERAPLKILGACNPTLAHQALELDPSVALVLPCNVVLESIPGGTHVEAVDPEELLNDERLCDLSQEAARRLRAALDRVEAQSAEPPEVS